MYGEFLGNWFWEKSICTHWNPTQKISSPLGAHSHTLEPDTKISSPLGAELGRLDPYNGLSPVRRQAITWTNTDLLSVGPLGTNFSIIRIKNPKLFIHENAFENIVCELNGGFFVRERQLKKAHNAVVIWSVSISYKLSHHKISRRSLELSDSSDIWRASRQHCCGSSFQILMLYLVLNYVASGTFRFCLETDP